MNDEFMNAYGEQLEGMWTPVGPFLSIFVVVKVSDLKWAANAVAAGLMGSAEALLVTAAAVGWIPFIGWATAGALVAAAAALAAVAAGSGVVALDPPSPDPLYGERVDVLAIEPSKSLADDARFGGVAPMVSVMARLVADVQALGILQGRLLGARVANARELFDMHASHYRDIQAHIQRDVSRLRELTERGLKVLRDIPELDLASIRSAIDRLRDQGVPTQLRTAWAEAGGSSDQLAVLESRMLDGTTVAQLIDNRVLQEAAVWLQLLVNRALAVRPPAFNA